MVKLRIILRDLSREKILHVSEVNQVWNKISPLQETPTNNSSTLVEEYLKVQLKLCPAEFSDI